MREDVGPSSRVSELEREIRFLRAQIAFKADDYRATFDHAGVGVAHVSLAGDFLEVNGRLCEMLGYSREQLLGMTFGELTHPEDIQPNLEFFEDLLSGHVDGYRMEKRYIRSTGEILWVDLTVSTLRDGDGRTAKLISVISDIGEKKQNEERLNFLLGEIAHRSKNMFAVVQAMMRQIGHEVASVRDFQQALDQRILGLAASQDALARHEQKGAMVSDLVSVQLDSFVTPGDPRIVASGPVLLLGGNAASVIGLALHELATNACKYGALASVQGRVAIAWSIEDEPSGWFNMSWTERDGPEVRPPTRIGFGRTVMERIAAVSLNGEVQLDFPPEGLEWRLRAPLSSIVR